MEARLSFPTTASTKEKAWHFGWVRICEASCLDPDAVWQVPRDVQKQGFQHTAHIANGTVPLVAIGSVSSIIWITKKKCAMRTNLNRLFESSRHRATASTCYWCYSSLFVLKGVVVLPPWGDGSSTNRNDPLWLQIKANEWGECFKGRKRRPVNVITWMTTSWVGLCWVRWRVRRLSRAAL